MLNLFHMRLAVQLLLDVYRRVCACSVMRMQFV